MNEKAIKVLEYNKIIELLKEQAGSEMTRKIISELKPFTDPRTISTLLEETDEAVKLISYKGPLPLGNFYDIKQFVSFAQKGGSLNMKQLLQILYNMKITANVITWLKGDVPPLPILQSLVEVLAVFKDLAEEIDRSIESEDTVSDNASSELRHIRRSIVRQNETIKNRINQMINKADNQSMLQDAIVTVRDGRYVIPVKQEHRSKFPGIVHDQSASGATLFIEPQVIVNMNNELRELEANEKAEVERILAELSSRVGEHGAQLNNNQEILVQLDLIMAKGKLAHLQHAECPSVNEDGILILKEARHPLIDRKKAVPINISIGDKYNTLVVTGPNTGGKTVTLKTAGLLSMMAQTGLHIPAASSSTIPIYENIFADIGDEQSIEQSLSTFSSHMKNIVEILAQADGNSLVLLDELGAGTDPTEGAALAISILENLKARGTATMATTHYNELKKYAISTIGVENASMEFDIRTLSPTYRLAIGIPGKSNAFEISKKLGIDESIIDRASHLIERGDIEFENVISAIEADKKKAENERDEAIMINAVMKKKQEELERKTEELKTKKEKIIADAREEARSIIRDAKETAKEVQKELKELSKVDNLAERNKRLAKSKKRLKEGEDKYAHRVIKKVNSNPVNADELKIGDRVKVLTLDQNGEILSLPDSKGDVQVQIGIMKANINISDLVLIVDGTEKKRKPKAAKYGSMYKTKLSNVSASVNVQGQNLDDALIEVDRYLDDVFIAGLEQVTIIHGRGEGILKNGIRAMLKKHKSVASFHAGKYNEGGEGVTIVTMKKG